jgi:hypothetical protein
VLTTNPVASVYAMVVAVGPLPLSSLVVCVLGVGLTHRLTIGRDKLNAKRRASVKFYSAILAAFHGLYPLPVNWPLDIEYALRSVFPAIQTAIAEFRPYVPWWQRRAFDRAWFRYRCGTGREIDLQIYLHYTAFRDNTDAKGRFRRNVAALLAFAK